MGNRVGRPEKSAGLPILVAILTAWGVGGLLLVGALLWLATMTNSAP